MSDSQVAEACFVVHVASITSDQEHRDTEFNGRILETETYPTATFVLTEPVVLAVLPEAGGDPVSASVTGR